MNNNTQLMAHEKETDVLDKIDGEKFLITLKKYNVDLTHFYLNKRNIDPIEMIKLNKAIIACKKEYGLRIIDCIVVLEKDYFPATKIVDLLSEKVRKLLRQELKEYVPHLKVTQNTLSSFFSTK